MNINKVCSEGKVVNPISGRCINKDALDKKMKKKRRRSKILFCKTIRK
jgi:hypothetical protein